MSFNTIHNIETIIKNVIILQIFNNLEYLETMKRTQLMKCHKTKFLVRKFN